MGFGFVQTTLRGVRQAVRPLSGADTPAEMLGWGPRAAAEGPLGIVPSQTSSLRYLYPSKQRPLAEEVIEFAERSRVGKTVE
jgi:hypothetical protein